ncbi:MAG: hypothetical protein ABIG11_01480 [bacterium]
MREETFFVDCPVCKALIEVEKKTGKVVRHWEKSEKKEGADPMADALRKMKENKSRLDKYFSGARDSAEARKKELEEKFEKEKKRIRDEGDTSRPINPMDLD